ncbi:MAG: TIGR04282 family arsenosugar biosynthesis glycosyltransferase [Euryarchaeota archaeon]|nr:TIGR04282 family arsenosugar biosynthesis glycosyltransferase [Euryarchaeota archaeon]
MDEIKDACILLFVKYPKNGNVKTRLATNLDETVVRELYTNFVQDSLKLIESLHLPFFICFSPKTAYDEMRAWLGKQYHYLPQKGNDLGERMKNSFLQTFAEGFNTVVLLGSDTPDLPVYFIKQAIRALRTNDVALGPSVDGGYYLFGCKKDGFSPTFFEGIHWSTSAVFQETIAVLKRNKKTVHILPEWSDIDTVEDIYAFIKRNKGTSFSRTMNYISNHKNLFEKR